MSNIPPPPIPQRESEERKPSTRVPKRSSDEKTARFPWASPAVTHEIVCIYQNCVDNRASVANKAIFDNVVAWSKANSFNIRALSGTKNEMTAFAKVLKRIKEVAMNYHEAVRDAKRSQGSNATQLLGEISGADSINSAAAIKKKKAEEFIFGKNRPIVHSVSREWLTLGRHLASDKNFLAQTKEEALKKEEKLRAGAAKGLARARGESQEEEDISNEEDSEGDYDMSEERERPDVENSFNTPSEEEEEEEEYHAPLSVSSGSSGKLKRVRQGGSKVSSPLDAGIRGNDGLKSVDKTVEEIKNYSQGISRGLVDIGFALRPDRELEANKLRSQEFVAHLNKEAVEAQAAAQIKAAEVQAAAQIKAAEAQAAAQIKAVDAQREQLQAVITGMTQNVMCMMEMMKEMAKRNQ